MENGLRVQVFLELQPFSFDQVAFKDIVYVYM